MATAEDIYYMAPSCEDDRPHIDLEADALAGVIHDWTVFQKYDNAFPPDVDVVKLPFPKFQVNAVDALEWDWYDTCGWGMISQRAKDLLWPYAIKYVRGFQTSLNGAPYYILELYDHLALDCLDLERSVVEQFKSSGRISGIKKYAFRPGIIVDPLIFRVVEVGDLLCTHAIKQMVEDAGFKGFCFYDVEHLVWR